MIVHCTTENQLIKCRVETARLAELPEATPSKQLVVTNFSGYFKQCLEVIFHDDVQAKKYSLGRKNAKLK